MAVDDKRPPVYEIRRCASRPHLDGWLSSPCWLGATWVDRFIAMDTWAPAKPASVALLWDDTTLYAGFKLSEPLLGQIQAYGTNVRDEALLELYTDPAGDGQEHVVFSLDILGNVAGDRWKVDNPGWGTRHPFTPEGVQAAARLTGSGWQLEVAIPFAALGATPAAGQAWRLNVCRIDKPGYQWSFWAPVDPVAHSYDLLPLVLFSEQKAKAPAVSAAKPGWPAQPRFQMRGFMYDTSRGGMIYTPGYWIERFPWFRERGLNTFLLYFENHLKFKSHGEFAPEGSWTLDELAAVQAAGAAQGIDVIPAQTSLGHCTGILSHPAYREMAEEGSDGYQFCASHPGSRRVMVDIFSELAAASSSPYISINADESAYLGLCPRCRKEFPGWSRGRIFKHHIMPIYEAIRAHGKRMMMWDDMLWQYPDALDGLPRDIILLDWHYSLHRRYPSIDRWRALGFDVVVCPGMYAVENAFWIGDHGAASGAMGLINTLWEDHSLPLGSRWQHVMATSWASQAKTPANIDDWFALAGETLFGPDGRRLGHSLAAQDSVARNGYRIAPSSPTRLEWQAACQTRDEARRLLEKHGASGVTGQMLEEFVYARRLMVLQSEAAWHQANKTLDGKTRAALKAEAEVLKREGLALWQRQCRVPSQQTAFLERYTALEKILA